MERHENLEAMSELKLYGMRASFDDIAGKCLARRDEIYRKELCSHLVESELIGKMRAVTYGSVRIYGEHMVDTSKPRGRVDIQVGAERRRRWDDDVTGRIVAESYGAGAVVSEVARRHGISPQHLFGWRKAARAGLLSMPGDQTPLFFPVVTDPRPAGTAVEAATRSSTTITIDIGGAVVRAAAGVDPAWLRDVLRAVRAAEAG
jgi:transposase